MGNDLSDQIAATAWSANGFATQSDLLRKSLTRHYERNRKTYDTRAEQFVRAASDVAAAFRQTGHPAGLFGDLSEYVRDSGERSVLMLEALRKRGDIFLEHEAAGAPPVLIYDYEIVVDGATLDRPCNYMLLSIKPPKGVEVFDWKRPYVIIDPRAGHGPGIGGFKPDSQVGVALADGHPVYFVAFRPQPVEGQTLADVTDAEATFLREVHRRHAAAPKPIVVGNCQGGWATAILAATNPDLAGPIVLNGAPMAYWSGRIGQDPMRYTGGAVGGVMPAMLTSDLGGGLFDGAYLVENFELLNPGRTWFRKYYDLFATIDKGDARFLEFEKWWGGFFLMTEAEIRWIVENLFVGNKLSKNEARLDVGRPIDLKAIRAPIIVFASHGDNITPPQQALNWIVDTYADEREIQIRGQRIIYMVHEQVGHLGIFVSSSVAKREHTQMASTLKTIEALAPGLYEMTIDEMTGEGQNRQFKVSFQQRRMGDILALDDDRREEEAFASVARLSETLAETYDTAVRPVVRAAVPETVAGLARSMHSMRRQRSVFSSRNPAMTPVAAFAPTIRDNRKPAQPDNPFVMAERLWADMVEHGWDIFRDTRAAFFETLFLSVYAHPAVVWYGQSHAHRRVRQTSDTLLRTLPEVVSALDRIAQGGLAEAVVRMLVYLADARGNVRRDRLERSAEVLTTRDPFAEMDAPARARMIHEQSLIAEFGSDAGLETLPHLLATRKEREEAMAFVDYVVGPVEEMEPNTVARMTRFRSLLGLAPLENKTEAAE